MSDVKTNEEPSIEEILGSIRRIIADDEDQPAAESAPAPAAKPAPSSDRYDDDEVAVPVAVLDETEEDEPLELTQKVDDDGTVIDVQSETELTASYDEDEDSEMTPAPTPAFRDKIVMVDTSDIAASVSSADPLVSHIAADATAAVMAKLARSTSVTRAGNEGATIEDLVKEMLRPMLSQWLDENLPSLVQNMVERELDKIARRVA